MKRIITLILVLVLASMANGAQKLTVNGQDVNSITLGAGQSCTFEVVSDNTASYADFIGFDDCNSLGDLYPIAINPAAGTCPHINEVNETYFCGYRVVADCLPASGVHFVFEYVAQELGETDLKLYDITPAELDSIHITITPTDKGTAFTYQGWLRDSNVPPCGYYDLAFGLYNAPEASEQQGDTVYKDDVYVEDGIFTVELDFGADVFAGEARWLEIAVRPGSSSDPNDFVTLSPRQKITPTPYAIYAQTAGTDNDWMVDGNNMYSIPSGNVGIGTTNPGAKLTLQEVDNIAGFRYQRTGGTITAAIYNDADGDNVFQQNDKSGAAKNVFSALDNSYITGGNVGIGTTNPQTQLHLAKNGLGVGPEIYLYKGGGLRTVKGFVRCNEDSDHFELGSKSGDSVSFFTSDFPRMTIEPDGKVGIGTTSPVCKLDVEGVVQAWGYLTGDIIFQKDGQKLWRMFEDENGLYLENVRTGKVYTFVLREAESSDKVDIGQMMRDLRTENEALKERIENVERAMQQIVLLSAAKEVQ